MKPPHVVDADTRVETIDFVKHDGLIHMVLPRMADRITMSPKKCRAVAAAMLLMCGPDGADPCPASPERPDSEPTRATTGP